MKSKSFYVILKKIAAFGLAAFFIFLSCTQKNPVDSTQSILGKQAYLVSLKANPSNVSAGGSVSVVRVTLLNPNDKPYMKQKVTFDAVGGTLGAKSATTDANGVAEVWFYSGDEAKAASVTATYGQSKKSISINIISSTASGKSMIFLQASKNTLYANGTDTLTVHVQLVPDSSENVSGQIVSFTSTVGKLPVNRNIMLDSGGKGRLILTSNTSPIDTFALITATYNELQSSVAIPFKAVDLTVTAEPAAILADGQSTSLIQVQLREKTKRIAITDARIDFSAEGADIQSDKLTDGFGKASVTLNERTKPDTVKVLAYFGDVVDSVEVYYTTKAEVKNQTISDIKIDKKEIWGNLNERATINVKVLDPGNVPAIHSTVYFESTAGMLAEDQAETDDKGIASVKIFGFSSDFDSTATITASLYNGTLPVSVNLRIKSESYKPNAIEIAFDPPEMGVKNTGQVQSVNIIASVKDNKNRLVGNNVKVRFSIIEEPGETRLSVSSGDSIPTLNGIATVTISSGTRAGVVRVRAELVENPEISVESTKLIIRSGPPYMADPFDRTTGHMRIVAGRLNVYAGALDTTGITVIVGDKYKNPIDPNTAVYFTTSGGVVTTQSSFTNDDGLASNRLYTGSPMPTINRFFGYDLIIRDDINTDVQTNLRGYIEPVNYGGDLIWNPNFMTGVHGDDRKIIPSYWGFELPDFENEIIPNSLSYTKFSAGEDLTQNDGIARVLAKTVGVDANGDSIYVWDSMPIIFSWGADYAYDDTHIAIQERDDPPGSGSMLFYDSGSIMVPGVGVGGRQHSRSYCKFTLRVYDRNGNPLPAGSTITAGISGSNSVALSVEPPLIEIGGGSYGTTYYYFTAASAMNPKNLTKGEGTTAITITITTPGGKTTFTTEPFTVSHYLFSEWLDIFYPGYTN